MANSQSSVSAGCSSMTDGGHPKACTISQVRVSSGTLIRGPPSSQARKLASWA